MPFFINLRNLAKPQNFENMFFCGVFVEMDPVTRCLWKMHLSSSTTDKQFRFWEFPYLLREK